MNRKIFSIVGLIILSILLVGAGFWAGQAYASNNTNGQYGNMMNGQTGMMNGQAGMMNGQAGMMNGQTGMMNGQAGMMNGQVGMMNGQAGMMDMMGMMTGFSGLSNVDPLTIEEAETAVSNYLSTLNQSNLTLGEIMIFSNHAYAQVLDSETGQGAFEVLVDPATGNVFPEPGPNMMWNSEYGMMGGSDMMNMMMGGMGSSMMDGINSNMMGSEGNSTDADISLTPEEASSLAQTYLDSALPGTTADDQADAFPGYYTLHVERDGEVIGMLSVNAYTGDVFLHHWHGDFIEMADTH